MLCQQEFKVLLAIGAVYRNLPLHSAFQQSLYGLRTTLDAPFP